VGTSVVVGVGLLVGAGVGLVGLVGEIVVKQVALPFPVARTHALVRLDTPQADDECIQQTGLGVL
jgi:hypothetical protein